MHMRTLFRATTLAAALTVALTVITTTIAVATDKYPSRPIQLSSPFRLAAAPKWPRACGCLAHRRTSWLASPSCSRTDRACPAVPRPAREPVQRA